MLVTILKNGMSAPVVWPNRGKRCTPRRRYEKLRRYADGFMDTA